MHNNMTRRIFLGGLAGAATTSAQARPVGLSYGTYGLWMFEWERALELIAETGYDGVEIALMPDWPTEPKLLSSADRKNIRTRLGDLGLELPAFLETLRVMHPKQAHQENLERLHRALDLGADLSPGKPPIVETILGRKTAEWDKVKNQMVDEIGDWVEIAAKADTVVCFKPHAGNAVHNVERSLWLIEQVGSPYLRCTYDYSHLWLEGHDLAASLKALLPVSPYIHVKDAAGSPSKHRYLLPGDGETDYVLLFSLLKQHGYDGFVNVEVSGQIHKLPDYEPLATAKLCYQRMSAAFESAGLKRP